MKSNSNMKKIPHLCIIVTHDSPPIDSDLETPSLVELSQSVSLTRMYHRCSTIGALASGY